MRRDNQRLGAMLSLRKKLLVLAALGMTVVITLTWASYRLHVLPSLASFSLNPQPLRQPSPAPFQRLEHHHHHLTTNSSDHHHHHHHHNYNDNADLTNRNAIVLKTGGNATTTTVTNATSSTPRPPPTTTSAPDRNRKRIVYSCTGFCGGWADRQKGIVAAHVLASMLGRDFGVRITFPCGLENFMDEGRVPWRVSGDLLSGKKEFKSLDANAVRFTKDFLKDQDLERRFPDDVTIVTMNMEVVQFLQKHLAASNLAWVKDTPVPDVYKRSLEDLFVLKPPLRSALKQLQTAQPSGTKLVCAQVRLGKNEGFPDVEAWHTLGQFQALQDFLRQYNDSRSYRIFFSSDSVEIMRRARAAFPDVYLDIPGPITHTDKSKGPQACDGFRKAILDEYALSTCDVLVISESGLGKVASFIRGTDRDLFLFRDDKVEPFTRNGTFPNKVGW